jgi:hypothetical protein
VPFPHGSGHAESSWQDTRLKTSSASFLKIREGESQEENLAPISLHRHIEGVRGGFCGSMPDQRAFFLYCTIIAGFELHPIMYLNVFKPLEKGVSFGAISVYYNEIHPIGAQASKPYSPFIPDRN